MSRLVRVADGQWLVAGSSFPRGRLRHETKGCGGVGDTHKNTVDWNNPLNKVEALYAGTMVERRNGTVVRDLTTVQTETGSVYVVMPVPASVQKAITVTVPPPPARPVPSQAGRGQGPQAPEPQTPRTANGKPDLTG